MGRERTGWDRFWGARLNKRSVTLLDRLADKPTASILYACNGLAETQAAYRFLAQEEIGWGDILASHFDCTLQRMQGRAVVLCLQDTTELDFHGRQAEGLGTLNFPAQRGMYLHPTYAISPEREPLGVLDAWMWVRDASKTASRSLPAGAKESCRWLEGYARLADQASLLPDTRPMYVAVRESDFLDWIWLGGRRSCGTALPKRMYSGRFAFICPLAEGRKHVKWCRKFRPGAVSCRARMGKPSRSLLYWHMKQTHPMTSSRSSGAC